ncbi:hypothetical protein R1flu_016634 [Riccia fluitans]|uniref:Uncharacterized protein n=1 Tax=Riccia fluitans TaxID=41844 RepID=A0ABD1YML7_9MARC
MDIRQVALGAAMGAAVAVNAALQSLQDAGSFLIRSPESGSIAVDPRGATVDGQTRAMSFDGSEDDEDFFDFRNVDDEDELAGITLQNCDVGGLPRTSPEPEGADLQQARIAQNSKTETCYPQLERSAELGTSSKRRKIQGPPGLPFLPFLPPAGQTEEAMSLMLQQTTNTVLSTLASAKGRRERMLQEVSRVTSPEKDSSLKLVNSFIDALDNVSDSLEIVQSALFDKRSKEPS